MLVWRGSQFQYEPHIPFEKIEPETVARTQNRSPSSIAAAARASAARSRVARYRHECHPATRNATSVTHATGMCQ